MNQSMTLEAQNILFSEVVMIFFSLSPIDQDVESFVSANFNDCDL